MGEVNIHNVLFVLCTAITFSLHLRGCEQLERLPSSMRLLTGLETLFLYGCTSLGLPQELKTLHKNGIPAALLDILYAQFRSETPWSPAGHAAGLWRREEMSWAVHAVWVAGKAWPVPKPIAYMIIGMALRM